METKRIFCEKCKTDVEYTIKDVPMTGVFKEDECHYTGHQSYCIHCGSPVSVPEINDYNHNALLDAYREKNNIIPLARIIAIPQKYAIGKRPLSLLLGWGEQTFTRYCDGDIPTKQYSNILTKIYEEPGYYAELLEAGKGNLKSRLSYEKSKKAVDNALLGSTDDNKSKINLVIRYLLNQCEDITPLALQKALYYVQGFYYAFYDNFLFPENCEAWVHGPVYREIYIRFKDYRFDSLSTTEVFDSAVFTSAEKAIFDSVINNFCCYSGKVLERFTHNETPWLTARGELPLSAPSDRIIPKELIGEYFTAVKNKYSMVNPGDIRVYALDMFRYG